MDVLVEPHLSMAAQPPARQPGFWNGLGMVVLYAVMQLAIGMVVAIALGIGYGMFAAVHGRAFDGASIAHWIQSPGPKVALMVVTVPIVAALTLWIIHWRWPAQWHRAQPPGFGFVAPANRWFFLSAVLLGIVGAFAGSLMTELIAHGRPVQQDVTLLASQVPLGMHLLLALAVVCIAPVVEEALFRGVLLSGLMRSMSGGWAILVSAVIFGGVHYPDFSFVWYPLPALVLLGLLLGWIRLRARSLWPAITLHATNNLVAVVGWFMLTAARR